jgi:hypothetical protein
MEPIIESGMKFGPYPEGDFFYIEKSKTYQKIQSSLKIAEFLLVKSPEKPVIWIVEAKSSTPRPETTPGFGNFIEEIREKLSNALTLGISIWLNRHANNEHLPQSFQAIDLGTVDFRLVLVIKDHQRSWLPPLQEALQSAMKPTMKIWNLSPTSIVVINGAMAKSYGLIDNAG